MYPFAVYNKRYERSKSTMQVQAIQGYFIDGIFYQQGQRVLLPERQLVIVNVLDIPISGDEIQKGDIKFWKEFDKLAEESADEELHTADFPHVHFGHELILFDDQE